jgi:hypothetical protein
MEKTSEKIEIDRMKIDPWTIDTNFSCLVENLIFKAHKRMETKPIRMCKIWN